MKKWVLVALVGLVLLAAGCTESWNRSVKDIKSGWGGLDRVATVYSADGDLIRTYEGKFDVEVNDYGNKVKFDIDGKRVLIYNAVVIVEER